MNQVQELKDLSKALRNSSADLVAINLLKQAGIEDSEARKAVYVEALNKEACYNLTQKGIDYDRAVSMVKSATINEAMLAKASVKRLEEIAAEALEKAAETIEAFELKFTDLEHQEKAPDITKIAGASKMTEEDLLVLQQLPRPTLTRLASAVEEPWALGKAAGAASSVDSDPFLAFLSS